MDPISLSEARARLPELVKRVANRSGEVVVIENRRRRERVALVGEAHLRSLEAIVDETRKRAGADFQLEGSMESDLSDDALAEAIAALRKAQDAADLNRLVDLFE